LTRPELERVDREAVVVLLPLGSCEQHGHHLPVYTDSYLVSEVATGVEQRLRERVLLLPTLWVGASEHHLAFGATVSVAPLQYVQLLISMGDSILRQGFRRLFLLNGHGGNIEPMRVALRELKQRYRRAVLVAAAYWEVAEGQIARWCRGARKEIGHAGEVETALLLATRAELVRRELLRDEPGRPEPDGLYVARTLAEQSVSGAVGYPTKATAEGGRELLERIVDAVSRVVDEVLRLPAPESIWSTEAREQP